MGFEGISVNIVPHHLIYGTLNNVDEFNWKKKVGVAAKNSGYSFDEYEEGYEGFYREFQTAFFDQRRFSYTPAILCKGVKP